MSKMEFVSKTSQGMIIIFLPIIILLSTLQIYALDKNFYLKEFKKYSISDQTKIEVDDLEKITQKLIQYLEDEENDLEIFIKIAGEREEAFGEREKKHMMDVKDLFKKGYIVRNGGLVSIVIAMIILIKLRLYKHLYKSLFYSSILSFLMMVILFIFIQVDFSKYFDYFHYMLFDNELWRLDPETDVLIQMLPLNFFIDIAEKVMKVFVFVMGVIGVISFYGMKKTNAYTK